MKRFRVLTSLLLCFAMMLCVCFSASAQNVQIEYFSDSADVYLSSDSEQLIMGNSYSKELLKDVYNGLQNRQDVIDISAYSSSVTDNDLRIILSYMMNIHPDLFYLSNEYNYGTLDGKIMTINPIYTMSGAELETAKNKYTAKIDGILSMINDSWSDCEKVVFVHDYIVSNSQYDTTYSKYDAYSLLVNGTAVCQGYSTAFLAIMERLGIPCTIVACDDIQHEWNAVQVNGKWYHVDCTYDDPTPDKLGQIRHTYCLVSHNKLLSEDGSRRNYYVYDRNLSFNSILFDVCDWKKAESQIVSLGDNWYYVRNNSTSFDIMKTDLKSSCAIEKTFTNCYWPVFGDGSGAYYNNASSCLGSFDGKLYYSTYNKIYSYDVSTKNQVEVCSPDVSTGYIYGFTINNSVIKCLIAADPNKPENGTIQKYALYNKYDYNADGAVNSADLLAVKWIIIHNQLSGAGSDVSAIDYIELQNYLMKIS